MSKNTSVPTSVSVSSLEHVGRNKKPKRKISRVRLPTPPPDPTVQESEAETRKPVAERTDDFLEYLENLQKCSPQHNFTRTNSLFTPVIATEDAFDHLEKLYKLMEQMLQLREQNAKLHRRVRDLEHFRKIQNLDKYVESVAVPDVSDMDTALAENLLDTILSDSKRDIKTKPAHQFRFRQSILRKQRHNSASTSVEKQPIDMERLQDSYRRTSALTGSDKKVSKWTKVKAAFRWEKASQTVSDVKSQDSGIGGMQPVNCEVARYLRVPSTSEDPGVSPSDSGACEISTPGTISSASSTEDVFCQGRRGIREDSTDDDQSFTLEYIPNLKDEPINLQKSPSGKSSRTTWAKMKDIIHTRNSVKKRNRLSGKSDDFKPEELTVSDEEVFESKSPTPFTKNSSAEETLPQISSTVIDRYQQAGLEDHVCIEQEFSPKTEQVNKLQEEIQKNYKDLQIKLSLEFQEKMREWEKMRHFSSNTSTSSNAGASSPLSPEELKEQAFKKKMDEWERIKGHPKHNMQLQSEERLPLEFRKKLQEWQRIKKGAKDDNTSNSQKKKLGEWPKWKSVGGQRTDVSPTEQVPLSDDFIKKLETWKQIKSHSYTGNEEDKKGNKTPSPKLSRKDGGSSRQSKKIKEQTEKELQWFEKELGKIEREKQRLERERQKFLDREQRLTKLRKSVMADNKQNILVQTPSGFYRFEGISRKFTQKLYEWEKAQGIAPEASTFALLSNCYVPTINSGDKHDPQARLVKSKSADSVMNSELNLTHPLMSQQPSSLSLNDVENLENELNNAEACENDLLAGAEGIDADEPEAVIVEVEDIIEETAAPLVPFMEKKRIPIYQQELGCMCEGEAKAAPKVQRSESTRAQRNYNLIEEIIDLLKLIAENENTLGNRESNIKKNGKEDEAIITECLKNLYSLQIDCSSRLMEKLVLLQEANTKVTSSIAKEEVDYTTNRFVEVLDSVQDLSVDLLQLAERLHTELLSRSTSQAISFCSKDKYPNISCILHQQNSKILELRRVLSYLCAASDSTAPGKKKKIQRNMRVLLRKSSSREKDRVKRSSSKEKSSPRTPLKQRSKEEDMESDEDINTQIAQGAIKKRYRYRQKGVNDRTLDESDDDDMRLQKKAKKKLQKVPAIEKVEVKQTETHENEPTNNNLSLDPDVIQKVAVPTHLNYVCPKEQPCRGGAGSPVQVFVKTTRKLFTPLIMSSFATESQKFEVSASPTVVSVPSFHRNISIRDLNQAQPGGTDQNLQSANTISRLPPLPASPTMQRKVSKDISPNIRLMLAKYNQKIQEHESPGCKSGGSSGSSSPVAWRSPTNERRVKTQTERYQQELLKLSPLTVQKSASLGFMNKNPIPLSLGSTQASEYAATNVKGILKSSSACALTVRVRSEQSVTISEENQYKSKGGSLKLTMPDNTDRRLYSDSRSYRLQKAKEEFLNSPVPTSAPPTLPTDNNNTVRYPERNRLSQISVGSESSHDSSAYEGILIKSASAGMINVDPETYKQIQPEIHGGGYVSLPRTSKKRKEGIMSNIASKFRKVKMRRNKDANKMNTVSTLCRQSLVVDISTGSEETLTGEQAGESRKDSLTVPSDSKGSSSADTSPSTSRSSSWIKKPRLFKPKQ